MSARVQNVQKYELSRFCQCMWNVHVTSSPLQFKISQKFIKCKFDRSNNYKCKFQRLVISVKALWLNSDIRFPPKPFVAAVILMKTSAIFTVFSIFFTDCYVLTLWIYPVISYIADLVEMLKYTLNQDSSHISGLGIFQH